METNTLQTKQILNTLLINNDINLIELIMSFNTDFCDICDKTCYNEITNQYCYGCNEYFKVCEACYKDNKCDSCDDLFCKDCQEETPLQKCDSERCCNDMKYCEECVGSEMGWCSGCEERKCCVKVYRSCNGKDYIYTCQECLEVVFNP